jgi:hypothetical protein
MGESMQWGISFAKPFLFYYYIVCAMNENLDIRLIRVSTFLPIFGFLIKLAIDAWAKTNNDVYAYSSIIQYSLLTLYISIVIGLVIKLVRNDKLVTNLNFNWFIATLAFLLIMYVAIIALYALRYSTLKNGYIIPSVSETINNWIMVPLWLLVFYNMNELFSCQGQRTCAPAISFYTLSIIAFGLMQLYLVHKSFNMVYLWPTDDIAL